MVGAEASGEGAVQREKEFKAKEEPGVGLKKRSGGKLEGKCGVHGGFYEGSSISGASFCICGWGERSEPWPHIQRLARGLRRGGDVKEERI